METKINQLQKIYWKWRIYYQNKRILIFNEYCKPKHHYKILDLGGGDGKRLVDFLPNYSKDNLYVADIDQKELLIAKTKGFNTIILDQSGKIPFADKYFDIIFCNSVIEHVTMDKSDCYTVNSWEEFNKKALDRQKLFADEIIRCGKSYFVQTPYRYFPIESHTWLPFFFIFFGRKTYLKFINFTNKYWIKGTPPDWKLFNIKEMKSLFYNGKIIKERSLFMVKSLIAVK